MHIGVTFPQTEIGPDPGPVRDYAQAAEALGYSHILVYDHVLGASTASRPGWNRPYSADTQFHEPFVLYGFLAAVTSRIGLATGVIILPQRQTALVAKQAAEVDRLSNGRLRLGVGLGWNDVEYEALGQPFRNRARRITEQVELLRALWTEPVISFSGSWHTVTDAGINPLPVQRPIPVWFGGAADEALRRAARVADGWFPLGRTGDALRQQVDALRRYVADAGRDVSTIGIEGSIRYSTDEAAMASQVREWRDLGATHVTVNTMGAKLGGPAEHIAAIRRFIEIANQA